MEDIVPSKPWLFNLRSSKQLIGLAVFSTTFTDGFLYGIVCVYTLKLSNGSTDPTGSLLDRICASFLPNGSVRTTRG